MHPFEPRGATATVSATTTSAVVSGLSFMRSSRQLQVVNLGPDVVFLAWGITAKLPSNTTTATTADYPVAPGATVTVTKNDADLVAIRSASTTATVYITPGTGF